MFTRLTPDSAAYDQTIEFSVNDRKVAARLGDTVAAALLAAGEMQFRISPSAGKPRGPYCMMGVCFECLVTIDGRAGRQACLTAVKPGMQVIIPEGGRND